MDRKWIWAAVAGVAFGVLIVRKLRSEASPRFADDQVTNASEDSFPASDPPALTPMIGSQVTRS
jgi:hypothetical protein